MALYDNYKGSGDAFNVNNAFGDVIDEMKARDKAVIDNVDAYIKANEEMDKLRGGVEAILSQYETDEKGNPSEAAPKYVHDAYKAAKKEGGLARMSKTQLAKVLQGYEVDGAERDRRMKEADVASQIALRGAQARGLAAESADRLAQAKEREAMIPSRIAEAEAQTKERLARAKEMEVKAQQAQREIDAGDFLSLANSVYSNEVAQEVDVDKNIPTYNVTAKAIIGFHPDGRPIYGTVSKKLDPAGLAEKLGETGQTRGEIIRQLRETGEKAISPEAEGIDPTEHQALATAMGLETPQVTAFKQEMEDTFRTIRTNLRFSENEAPAIAAVLSEDRSNDLYGTGLRIIWDRYKNDPSMSGLASLITIKNPSGSRLPDGTSTITYLAKDPTALRDFLLRKAGDVTLASAQEAGLDATTEANRIYNFGPIFKDYRSVRNGVAIEKAQVVMETKRERVLMNINDSETIARVNYEAAVAAWKARNPTAPVPVSFNAFAAQTMSNAVRTVTIRNPDGSIKRQEQMVNTGGPNNPKWEVLKQEGGSSAKEQLEEIKAKQLLNAMDFGSPNNPMNPPREYGDIKLAGMVTRNAGGETGIASFQEALSNYDTFVGTVETLGDTWDDMGAADLLFTDRRKVLDALIAIARMQNKDILIGTGTVTQLDMDALNRAMQSPEAFSSWFNSGGNRTALRALASQMKQNLMNKAKEMGLQVADNVQSPEQRKAAMDAAIALEAQRASGTRLPTNRTR